MDTPSQLRADMVLPDLGVADVIVGVWYARIGERVYHGERVVEVIINGATFDVTAPATGTLIQRSVVPGDHIKTGTVLGAVAADPE